MKIKSEPYLLPNKNSHRIKPSQTSTPIKVNPPQAKLLAKGSPSKFENPSISTEETNHFEDHNRGSIIDSLLALDDHHPRGSAAVARTSRKKY